MALKRCENGHYFDPAKHPACPTCTIRQEIAAPPSSEGPGSDPQIRRVEGGTGRAAQMARAPVDAWRTQRRVRTQSGIDPVVGWLVCVAGPETGNDYRLHAEKNFIGRGETMDVRIASDNTISRENHAALSFDPKKECFRLLPGDGRGLVYLNGEEVVAPEVLNAGDRIELGDTVLLFVPLCGPDFRWPVAETGAT